jgi:L-ascorbate metabolism protein UlaG (beta-lactamase superfamily)
MIDITWLGHGTFLLTMQSGETILIDPWLEGNPKFPVGFQIPRLDVMLITHGHFDHISSALPLLKQFTPQVIANHEIATWLASKGAANVCGMNKGGCQQAGPLRVTMTQALHSSSIDDNGTPICGGEPAGYVLHLPTGKNAYFAGDTSVFSDMELYRRLYRPELAFLPIGDLYTMGPEQAALACKLLQPRTVIPMHFGTFPALVGTPEQLAALVEASGTRVWTLEPGRTVRWE